MIIAFDNPMRATKPELARVTEAEVQSVECSLVDTTPGVPLSEAGPELTERILPLL